MQLRKVAGALRAGARGFLLKGAWPELMVQAIHAAASGDAMIAPSVTARVLARFVDTARPTPVTVELTERDVQVAAAVAEGLTNAEIGQ